VKRNLLLLVSLLILSVAAAGCGPAGTPGGQPAAPAAAPPAGSPPPGGATATPVVSHGGAVTDYVSMIDRLRAAGSRVEPVERLSQPFFPVDAQVITLNGARVQVFEFESETAASAQAAEVSGNGSTVGTTMVTWVEPPHFYQQGRLIVLYVGSDAQIGRLLESVLGPQIAGGAVAGPPPGQAEPTATPRPVRQQG
jgi:hypothetical protein